jgi:two-component system cell cycle sensor histidine kinase/response regulator CckA
MNLAVNARDAMPEGGRLTIETQNIVLDEECARSHVGGTAGPHVMLAMSDTGHGIGRQTMSRLFEPFFTTKEQGKGTGLGLATVYGIVRQSGGNIWVYSEPGEGTTFKTYLPREGSEPTQLTKREGSTARGAGELVLLVEDDPDLRELFARTIKGLGYRVTAAANGGEALIAVEEGDLRPDLLISDVILPGMNGKVLAERLGRRQPGLKVLYMSGYTGNTIAHHGVLDPGTAFLQKPFSGDDLAAKIDEVIGSKEPSDRAADGPQEAAWCASTWTPAMGCWRPHIAATFAATSGRA